MVIRYRKIWGIALLVLTVIILLLEFVPSSASSSNESILSRILIPIVFFILGISYLIRKYFAFDKQSKMIRINALLGPVARKYYFDRIYLQNNRVYIELDREKKKIPIWKSLCNRKDYEAFIKEIKEMNVG